ncbi:MAG: hypothetical protein WCF90_04770 [Methanomicrobiales archaeon]
MGHLDRPPACRAGPAFPLGLDKRPDTLSTDLFEVLHHTHAVLFPVPLIQLAEPLARIFTSSGGTKFAVHLFATRNRTILITFLVWGTLPVAIVLLSEIRHADGAVHATRRNDACPEGVMHCH